jgi:ATP-dependent protease ClpP protease subunit
MGLILLCAGFKNENVKKRCYPFSVGMIHEGSMSISGTLRAVFSNVDFQKKIEKRIKEYVCSHSKIKPRQYDKMNRTETYMTSEDMRDLGLVDEIL